MPFGDSNFDALLPHYLVSSEKTRLREALSQFTPEHRGNEISYKDFYKEYQHGYFMQADLVKEIRLPFWNGDAAIYEKTYTDAIIVSNTCDISFDNRRDVNPKQCLLAPIIDLKEYVKDLRAERYDENKVQAFLKNVKQQQISNIFFLPAHSGKEYIALLDRLFWFPTEELKGLDSHQGEDKIASLNYYGFYLFVLKLSYHLCRLPEQCDRAVA